MCCACHLPIPRMARKRRRRRSRRKDLGRSSRRPQPPRGLPPDLRGMPQQPSSAFGRRFGQRKYVRHIAVRLGRRLLRAVTGFPAERRAAETVIGCSKARADREFEAVPGAGKAQSRPLLYQGQAAPRRPSARRPARSKAGTDDWPAGSISNLFGHAIQLRGSHCDGAVGFAMAFPAPPN
jgi:hypothetical protein